MSDKTIDIFQEHAAAVYGWAHRILRHHHDALDVVQDVFLRWRSACMAEVPTRPRNWLRRVSTNRAIDLLRRREAKMPAAENEQLVEGVCGTDGQAEKGADLERLRADVARALGRLSPMQR